MCLIKAFAFVSIVLMVAAESRTLLVMLFKSHYRLEVRSAFDHNYHSLSLLIAAYLKTFHTRRGSVGRLIQVPVLVALAAVAVIDAKPASVNSFLSRSHQDLLSSQ
jgi:hypothetical protein